jgi:hypothetical protein
MEILESPVTIGQALEEESTLASAIKTSVIQPSLQKLLNSIFS